MATNRDMLAEAIADAKALKETAIANAKAALEEAFEPRLKSMLSAKLQEMEDEDLEEAVTNEAKEEVEEMTDPVMRKGLKGDDKEEKRTEKMREAEDMDEEMDLDEILAELDEDARTDAEEEGYEDGMKDEKEDMEDDMEDEEIDLEDMSEEDLKSFIEDVIADMVTSGELEAGEEFEVEDEDEVEVEDDEDIDVEDDTEVDVEVNEAKEEVEEAAEPAWMQNQRRQWDGKMDQDKDITGVSEEEDLEEGLGDLAKKIWNDPEMMGAIVTVDGKKYSLKDLLKKGGNVAASVRNVAEEEIMAEVETLRAELQETNLLNAKLLYTNKIFRAKNLKEAQKVKVLEAFDKASNVSEVKLIFETLNEGMVSNVTKAPIKENLGSASKAAGVAQKAPIMEIDPQVARWQKLAGIK